MTILPIADGGQLEIRPSKIIALGLNYLDHIGESASVGAFEQKIPREPILFAKTPNVITGPGQPIIIPRLLQDYDFGHPPRVDYEAELAFIIKERCKAVPAADALSVILGFTCFNDVSQRDFQKSDASGWFRGKSLDTFGPIGPRIVPPALLGDPQNLDIECRLNGRVVQKSNTRHMIFPVPAIVAFVSRHFTLEAGDVITTGTPAGVGPLQPGDVVEIEIAGIGVLRNPVVAE